MPGNVHNDTITYGGVTFDRNQVKETSSKTKKNVTTYYVSLNDGTELTYREVPREREAFVELEKRNDKTFINFFGLTNAKIKDTEDNNIYTLMGCEFTTIDADRQIGKPFERESLDKDYIYIYDRKLDNGTIQESTNNTSYVTGFDVVNMTRDNKLKNNTIHEK